MTTETTNTPLHHSRRFGPGGWETGLGHALMILASLICVFPIYWMIVTSLRPENAIFSTRLWPDAASLDNYAYALKAVPITQMLVNTFIVSIAVTVIQIFTGILAAYGFSRWKFRGSAILFAAVALTWLVPLQVVMIPNYLLVARMGMIDTLGALILPHFASAFAIMLLAQSMRSFPTEVIEAAHMDGANHAHILWQVIVPNLRGTIASLAILIFITTWNEYFWPLLLTRSPENSVIQIGLQMFITSEGTQWGPLMAASTMASLPILLVYLVLQRQVIASFMKSGLR
ncbi:Lactose transport system permease protein LacG (plasmid) [Sulfitobacter pontiacus]|jgi:ABC-type glycerol-3-phosphate transport system permease component|uniref:sn-glycerol-3-phosphate transport system permease protein UgpE n=1 Tax=Sulfitobacter pontiacus TaxID=60137 RepID=A0AAX3AHU2_9RHOB|nr:carbohydrate ABC transporter permease [Sulfitobacter pontiacus]UOA25156.1 Lactose transport system permease protein LacG [Sulfitobacter pontiacus]WPZ27730.1 carbohydrate ABC transporter permease [Sulfitobacter pontiacus]|tara:strand:+ start:6139 stop:6999 length:861 start_codon:yes stop_codon:yes gene_type:complete